MNARDPRCRVSARLLPCADDGQPLIERIRVACPLSADERRGVECAKCDRLVGWGFSTGVSEPWLICHIPCASCGGAHEVPVNQGEVVFCDQCRERAIVTVTDELGDGD